MDRLNAVIGKPKQERSSEWSRPLVNRQLLARADPADHPVAHPIDGHPGVDQAVHHEPAVRGGTGNNVTGGGGRYRASQAADACGGLIPEFNVKLGRDRWISPSQVSKWPLELSGQVLTRNRELSLPAGEGTIGRAHGLRSSPGGLLECRDHARECTRAIEWCLLRRRHCQ